MKVESYKIKGWKEKETGLFISENEDWILVNHIPNDYALDGFKLYRKKFVKKRVSESPEKQIEKVLRLKNIQIPELKNFTFNDVLETLKWSEKKYGQFEFQDKKEDELFYGKINRTDNDLLIIDMIKSNGQVELNYDFEFKLGKIRSITFETDYFESIRVLFLDEAKNNLQQNL
ncbi:hypothetical protein [Tenacibaculum sp. E3R01]|uniref:hypothetical protein n=1 Tax=Tenacibaculum sp. E3R01 TaxID=2267227 RepID=UPI0011BF0BC4|nr:hypothetical protein [Tenacibaculum sp. E3R01]